MLSAVVVWLSAIAMIVVVVPGRLSDWIYSSHSYKNYIPLLLGLLASEVLFQFLVAILRAAERIGLLSLYTILKGLWRLGAMLLVLHGTHGDFHRSFLVFVTVQLIIVGLLYVKDLPVMRILRGGIGAGRVYWGEVLSFSLPLVFLAVMTGLNNFIDRFFLTHLCGLEEVAVYAASFSLAAIVAFFYSILGFTLFPTLARYWAQGLKEEAARTVGKAMQLYLFLLAPFIAVMALLGSDIMILLTTTAYNPPIMVNVLIACNIGFFGVYQIAFYVSLLGRGSLHGLRSMGAAIAVNVLLNALLVPRLGMLGAGLSGFASNLLLAWLTLIQANRIMVWRFSWVQFGRTLFHTGIMVIFLWVMTFYFKSRSPIGLVSLTILAGLLYLSLDLLSRKNSIILKMILR
jgi:O-antigen/teichoic acid export membrane protein